MRHLASDEPPPLHSEPASPGQRLLWMLDHHRGAPGSLNCPLLCRLSGPIDAAALGVALQRLTARHESLRTTFRGRGRHLTQVVHPPRPVPVTRVDLRGRARPGACFEDALAGELSTPIDVARWPVRVTLWDLPDDVAVLCVNVHHLVTDAWSCGVVFDDLVRLYGRALGLGDDPGPPGWPYRRWARWQERSGAAGRSDDREHWRALLHGARPVRLGLRSEPGRPAATTRLTEDLDRETCAALGALARTGGVTLFSLALAAFYAVLRAETGQSDLALASLFANRARPEIANSVGFFANLVVLRVAVDERRSFLELARTVQLVVVDALVHEGLPYHLLPARALADAGARFDDVVFQMLPGFAEPRAVGDLRIEALVPEPAVSRFGLELMLAPRHDGVTALLQYAQGRVPPDLARRLLHGYRDVLRAGARQPQTAVQGLPA